MKAFFQRNKLVLTAVSCFLGGMLMMNVLLVEANILTQANAQAQPTPTPAFKVGQEPFGLSQLTVQAWCQANNDKILECLPKHFKQIDQNSVLYTADAGACDPWFEIGEHPNPPVMVAQLKYGNGFEGYPYWQISATPASLVDGCVILFSSAILMDQQGKIVRPEIPAEYQPAH